MGFNRTSQKCFINSLTPQPEEVGHVRSANKINLLNCIFWMPVMSTCIFQDGTLRGSCCVKGGKLGSLYSTKFSSDPSYFVRG